MADGIYSEDIAFHIFLKITYRSAESAGLSALRHARLRPPQAYCMVR